MNQSEMKSRAFDPRMREATVSVRECGDDRKVRVSVSSEAPVPEYVFDAEARDFVYANEVLGHGEGEIDMSRCRNGLVIQDTHRGDQIGIIREVEIADGKLGGEIEFCCGQRAQEIKQDALAGIRTSMSVGYFVERWEKVSDGNRAAGELPTYRAVKWTPYEASFVNVPADIQVGVGRGLDVGEKGTAENPPPKEERNSNMEKPVDTPAVEQPAVDMSGEVRALKDEIVQLREALKKPEMPEAKRAAQFDDAAKKEIGKRYNLVNVIRSMVAAKDGSASGVDIGFEREMSQEISHQTKREAKGFFVPDCVLSRAWSVGGTAGTGGYNLVATDTLFGNFIEALVADTVLGKAGVRTLTGLTGNIAIPKGAAATAYWISAEGGDVPTESTPNIGQVLGTPHTLGAYTDITRKLLNQGGISPQAYIANELRNAIMRGIDAAGFAGTGANGQPTGLEGTTGVGSVTMVAGAPTKANMISFWSGRATANALLGTPKFICSPAVKGLLAGTLDYTAVTDSTNGTVGGVTSGKYLCENDKVEGYDVLMSNLCGAKKLYFGDWSQMILAFWSGIDLTVDTNSLSKSGGVRVVALQDMDVLVRHPEAFAIGTALS